MNKNVPCFIAKRLSIMVVDPRIISSAQLNDSILICQNAATHIPLLRLSADIRKHGARQRDKKQTGNTGTEDYPCNGGINRGAAS